MDMYDKISDPIEASVRLGQSVARSGFFGGITAEAGTIIAFECLARKITPQSFNNTYHILKGKITKRADSMLAEFTERGGKYDVIERTSEACVIKLTKGDRNYESSCTHEEVQQETFYRDSKGIAQNYATPRRRMQALFARAVSDGVRVVDPFVCAGVYTPEEVEDMPADPVIERTAATKKSFIEAVALPPNMFDGVFQRLSNEHQPADTGDESPSPNVVGSFASQPQVAMLLSSMETAYGAEADAKLQGALAKRNLESAEQLTPEQCDELIGKLQATIRRNGGAEKN